MRKIHAARLLVVSFLLLLLSPASSSAKDSWISMQSKNFTLIGNAAERDIRKLAIRLEPFRQVISLLFPRAQIETPVPTTVILFKNHDSFRTRSYLYLRRAYGVMAASDAINYLKRQGWRDRHSAYMAVAANLGFRQQRRDNPYAAKVLEDAATKLDATEWPYPVIRYLRRELTAEKLLELATDNDKLTEAHAYVGLDLSLAGSHEAALTHLRWVKENGNRNFVEYPLALEEIGRIEAMSSKQSQ